MSDATSDSHTGLVRKVLGLARSRLPSGRFALLEAFAGAYLQQVAPEDLSGRGVEETYSIVLAHFNFAGQRRRGQAKVNIYNPHHEQQGWQSAHTVVEVVTDDMPFLVDSVRMELNRRDLTIHLLLHPILQVRRDAGGKLEWVDTAAGPEGQTACESLMHIEVDRQSDDALLVELRSSLTRVLDDVRAAVDDWGAMRERMQTLIVSVKENPPPLDASELAEGRAFLEWLLDGHFTFLGFCRYELRTEQGEDVLRSIPGTGLGVLRGEKGEGRVSKSFAALSRALRELARRPELLVITKASSVATVHRPVPLDYIGVKDFGEDGSVIGEHRFLGLYSRAAYNRTPGAIPLLRQKVARLMLRSGFAPASYSGKALLAIIDNYPRDELFLASEDELEPIITGILHLQERRRVRLFLRRDPYGRFYSCLVFVPRDRYDTTLRQRMQAILLEALGGSDAEFNVHFSESVLARVHFNVHTPTASDTVVDVAVLEQRLADAARSWQEDLAGALLEHFGEERGAHLRPTFQDAFPAGYREHHSAWTAVFDIEHMLSLAEGDGPAMSLYRPLEDSGATLHFKLFSSGEPIPLSDVIPMLENMGVRVQGERPFRIGPGSGPTVWIHDFDLVVAGPLDAELELESIRGIFQDAFAGIWRGDFENDGFNRLVLKARLTGREVTLLRAVCKYLLQVGIPFSQAYMEKTLAEHPAIARLLVRLFQARFKPQDAAHAASRSARLREMLSTALEAVSNLDDDRILRRFLSVIEATLRTNFYQRDSARKPRDYVSIKLDPHRIPDLPLPRPMFEIFVYSPRLEGVHLRGGKVARGGLRWSDRREDFRTEILGLMKAQTVKNTVIVPVGAKGGFVLKRPLPAEAPREALQEEVVFCYRTFIRGLLDITDNLVGGEVVAPPDVVRYDDGDPYLVVAADKGTATFSDLANATAQEYGFWLGDAFASGGEYGYDHKKMGITARGAWESVKRLFRELGVDVHATPFTAVGVGDMSGDVFGNGMLYSRGIKLVAAFDHRHVFLDPDPDPETSFGERERLFRLPRSSWADYDPGLISAGGGVFSRAQKSIPITDEVRRVLGITHDRLSPVELIQAILKAPVDLLWNGGIGTYVKATGERHADVGDRSNDSVRVNGCDLRCRVVGEGGNLGLTQLARVEYARTGGRIHTDFIDNSGGVDCSDREVNIKILLNTIVAAGDLTGKQRNRLLAEMTDEVAELVLRDNYQQAQSLSLTGRQAVQRLGEHQRFVRSLEKAGNLNRELEALPSEDEFKRRHRAGEGLTVPELSVLLAYSKIVLFQQLVASDVPEDPHLSVQLVEYFPLPLRERFHQEMGSHRLRREIIANQLTNELVNRLGSVFAHRMAEETGATAADIARAFAWVCAVFDLGGLWRGLEQLDGIVAADLQLEMMNESAWLAERACLWFLRTYRAAADGVDQVTPFRAGIADMVGELARLLGKSERSVYRRRLNSLQKRSVPGPLAERVAALPRGIALLDIVTVTQRTGCALSLAARLYFHLGDEIQLPWLRDQISALPQDNYWQTRARAALRDDLYRQYAALATAALQGAAPRDTLTAILSRWRDRCGSWNRRWEAVVAELRMGSAPGLEMLSVTVQELRDLVAGFDTRS